MFNTVTGNKPPLSSPVPFYAEADFDRALNADTLADREITKEALRYFKEVSMKCRPRDLLRSFDSILESMPDSPYHGISRYDPSSLILTTMALAAIEDLEVVAPFIDSNLVPYEYVSDAMQRVAIGLPFDMLSSYLKKGRLDTTEFCSIFHIKPGALAQKIIADDNVECLKLWIDDPILSSSYALIRSLSRVPYDGTSKVRNHLDFIGRSIDKEEFGLRYKDQLAAIEYNYFPGMALPGSTTELHIGGKTNYSQDRRLDYGLADLPGILEILEHRSDEYLNEFAKAIKHTEKFTNYKKEILPIVIDLFRAAKVPLCDILVKGITNYQGFQRVDYDAFSAEVKQASYPALLLECAITAMHPRERRASDAKLTGILHLIRSEPVEDLEQYCATPLHWHVLYRATQDKKYLPRMENQIERQISDDLGL